MVTMHSQFFPLMSLSERDDVTKRVANTASFCYHVPAPGGRGWQLHCDKNYTDMTPALAKNDAEQHALNHWVNHGYMARETQREHRQFRVPFQSRDHVKSTVQVGHTANRHGCTRKHRPEASVPATMMHCSRREANTGNTSTYLPLSYPVSSVSGIQVKIGKFEPNCRKLCW